MSPAKLPRADRETFAQRFIFAQFQERMNDAEGVDLFQHPRFLAMADKTADVTPRHNHGTSRGEELRKLSR
jgi:hypothetical protein